LLLFQVGTGSFTWKLGKQLGDSKKYVERYLDLLSNICGVQNGGSQKPPHRKCKNTVGIPMTMVRRMPIFKLSIAWIYVRCGEL